jgi:hypothetical protein
MRRLGLVTAPSIPNAPSDAARSAFLAAVRAALPDLKLLDDPADRESYRSDETAYLKAGLPLAVALPTSTAEVSSLVRSAGSIGSRSCRAARAPA